MNYVSRGLCCAALFLAGCATSKPLLSVNHATQNAVRLSPTINDPKKASFSTVSGRRERELTSQGLLGAAIGATMIAFSDGSEKEYLRNLRNSTGHFETALVTERFNSKLDASNVLISKDDSKPLLDLKITKYGLREVQRGFFAPYVYAEATLTDPKGKRIWRASAYSIGINDRRKEEFHHQPELYRKDFVEVAEDLSRQLIEGPIRAVRR